MVQPCDITPSWKGKLLKEFPHGDFSQHLLICTSQCQSKIICSQWWAPVVPVPGCASLPFPACLPLIPLRAVTGPSHPADMWLMLYLGITDLILWNISKKASSYIAQYPVLMTVQSALHFTSLTDLFTHTPSRLLWEASNHMLQLRLLVHITTAVYSQVLIYSAEWTGAM